MRLLSKPVGPFQMNCYVIGCPDTGEGAIIDPGDDLPWIERAVRELGVTVKSLLLTHSHLDHVGALTDAKRRWPDAPIVLHRDELEMYRMAPQMAALFGLRLEPLPDPDRFTREGETLTVGRLSFEVLDTPGHSPGSVSYVAREQGVVFSGDALFAGSIGRTDLPGCDHRLLMRSLGKLRDLPPALRVLSGHGPATTIGQERRTNPFLLAEYGPG
jgi:glyoxylase-like metal-dependent hydrolase (beta-lactamase superfamily II)